MILIDKYPDDNSQFITVVSNYPTGKVIITYALLGGAIGGLIVFLYVVVASVIKQDIPVDPLPLYTKTFIGCAAIGAILGLVPALLMAYSACKFEIYLDSLRKVIPVFAMGFISTFICTVWFMLDQSFTEAIKAITVLGCIGGVSAIITGFIALPKHR